MLIPAHRCAAGEFKIIDLIKECGVPEGSREQRVTADEVHGKLRAIASDNTLSCEQIQQFASDNGLALESMRELVESAGIIILGCRGACS
jgi:hypothetical protein